MSSKWDSMVLARKPSAPSKSQLTSRTGMVFGVIADENTVVGFLLAGVGYAWPDGLRNVFVVERTTKDEELEACFHKFVSRDNVAIIVITHDVAMRMEHCLASHVRMVPVVLTVPSPYDTSDDDDKDSYDSSQRIPSEVSSHKSRSEGAHSM